ncbi:mechanosensitive ion channel family protein [Mesorhizobium xinjiangense]|uniref:mechanosensitive ion channel family protein n=1 Tax=Mesorhizobium xinjiangense TaxID=2678685 RepID=UPI0018DBACA6|nr:mechanosensitive ion channel domain-containing protein [Mesorhizobium xinjiangense]
MEQLEANTADMANAAQAAVHEASGLVVQYSFSVIGAIILLIVGYFIAGVLERWASRGLGRVHGFDETLRRFFSKLVRYIVLIFVVIAVLAQFGVQTASILAALGAAGLAIGLALQGTLQNIAAGIMLLVLRPFRVGEFIDAGGLSGTIEEIGLFATELKTLDGLYVLAPNSQLWSSSVTNYSRNAIRRNDLTIGIGYGDDIELAQKTLAGLVDTDARVLGDPESATFVVELGDSAVSVTARYWTKTADWWQTKLDLTKAAKLAFDKKGISIPYPQSDVHLFQAKAS